MTDTPDSPPRTMRAQRLNTTTRTFTVEDVPVPTPGPGEALIKVAYCGICHSDISVIDGTFPGRKAEVIQGHEASGTIAELGPGVTGWNIGDRVILAAGRPDGTLRRVPPRQLQRMPQPQNHGNRLRRRMGRIHHHTGHVAHPGPRTTSPWTRPPSSLTQWPRPTGPSSTPPRYRSANQWASGASVVSAPTSFKSLDSSAPSPSSLWTFPHPPANELSSSVPTPPSTPPTPTQSKPLGNSPAAAVSTSRSTSSASPPRFPRHAAWSATVAD